MKPRPGQYFGAAEIEAALAKKFAAPAYAFMPQCNQGTGLNAGRRADAVAMSLWPSRGLHLHGFEIKISRSDLAVEIKKPEKAEAIQKFCDFWWLVTPKGLTTELDILPPTWGVMEVNGRGVSVKRQAPKLEPQPLALPMIAAMFRSFSETIPYLRENFVCVDDLQQEITKRVEEEVERRVRVAQSEVTRYKERVARFEEESGISLDNEWQGGKIGAVAKALAAAQSNHRTEHLPRMLNNEADKLRAALATVEAASVALNEWLTNRPVYGGEVGE